MEMKQTVDIIIGCFLAGFLLNAAVCDIKKREIPDYIDLLLFSIGIVKLAIWGISALSLADAVAGSLIAGIPLLIAAVKTKGIGGGDVKLAACGGFLLGLYPSCAALFLSLLLFLFFSLIYIKAKKLSWRTSLPFAPFYAAACTSVYFLTFI